MENPVRKLKEYMDASQYTVAITGAGISYLSGMRLFKQQVGRNNLTQVLSPEYIKTYPDEIYAWFKVSFLDTIFGKGPSSVHYQMAELEKRGKLQGIVTQNLDNLHTLAGSGHVVEFMGSFADNFCVDCGNLYHDINVWNQGEMPHCVKCGGYLIPVYFGRFSRSFEKDKIDTGKWMEQAKDMIAKAELLLIIGTTGFHSDEYLSGLRQATKQVQINPESTLFDPITDLNIRMDAEKVFEEILEEEQPQQEEYRIPEIGNPTPEQMQKLFEVMQKKENEGMPPEEIERKNREKEGKKQKNIAMIQETLEICQKGSYEKKGKTVQLNFTPSQMAGAQVFLPEEIRTRILEKTDCEMFGVSSKPEVFGTNEKVPCIFSCENKDALSLAYEKIREPSYMTERGDSRILLLNLASAVSPGGGVRNGMGGQEEDLCRNSSLLLSLESETAKPYYEYNRELNRRLGSDAVILSPDVVVFRDEKGELLDTPFTISVLTCSAPNVRFGFEGKTEEEYRKILYDRIEGMLWCAAGHGYKNIILGAFGCGAFKNDAALVSDDFYQLLSGPVGGRFTHVDFAVLCTPGKEYNYNEFCRNFSKGKGQ